MKVQDQGDGVYTITTGCQCLHNPLCPLIPLTIIGSLGTLGFCIATTALSNEYVEDSQDATMLIFITLFYAVGVIMGMIWAFISPECRKKHGKGIYISMEVAFCLTVICDIVAIVQWGDVVVNQEYFSKTTAIAMFFVTLALSIALSVCCTFMPRCAKKCHENQQRYNNRRIELMKRQAAAFGQMMMTPSQNASITAMNGADMTPAEMAKANQLAMQTQMMANQMGMQGQMGMQNQMALQAQMIANQMAIQGQMGVPAQMPNSRIAMGGATANPAGQFYPAHPTGQQGAIFQPQGGTQPTTLPGRTEVVQEQAPTKS